MTEDKEARIFGAVEITDVDVGEDWRKLSRAEMFKRLIVTVDGSKAEAVEVGDENYVRYVDAVLFPFLEAELKKEREKEREYEEDVRYLVDKVGVSEDEARKMMRDEDLWIIEPAMRYGSEFEGERGVRLWEDAYELADGIATYCTNHVDLRNPAITQLASDAAERAREALRRARGRASFAGEAYGE